MLWMQFLFAGRRVVCRAQSQPHRVLAMTKAVAGREISPATLAITPNSSPNLVQQFGIVWFDSTRYALGIEAGFEPRSKPTQAD
jgi:hypothetical protein